MRNATSRDALAKDGLIQVEKVEGNSSAAAAADNGDKFCTKMSSSSENRKRPGCMPGFAVVPQHTHTFVNERKRPVFFFHQVVAVTCFLVLLLLLQPHRHGDK